LRLKNDNCIHLAGLSCIRSKAGRKKRLTMEKTDKQPQTIGEWFDWAEENGYEWAKEAREETIRLRGDERLGWKKDALVYSLQSMFCWSESKKGHFYWQQIHDSI
jgi:hypothetical protein